MVKTSIYASASLVPPLENGDRLTRQEFERRYSAMSTVRKATVTLQAGLATLEHGDFVQQLSAKQNLS
jgi:hypothetical protein